MRRTRMHSCALGALIIGLLVVGCEEQPPQIEEEPEITEELVVAERFTTLIDESEEPVEEADEPSSAIDGDQAKRQVAQTTEVAPLINASPSHGPELADVISGEGGEQVVQGAGGLGIRGTGRSVGGGAGLGRVGGLGKFAKGGGKGTNVGYGMGGGSAHLPRVRTGKVQVRGSLPRDVASNTEDYKNYGTNRFTDPVKDPLSTFAADVDTGSYTIARRKLNDGQRPAAASVRVEEFVNYFGYAYPAPKTDAFAVSLEAAPSPFSAEKNRYVMRVGVQAKKVTAADRKPVHLTFLVDVSGSMQSRDKIGLAKKSLKLLTKNLREHDTVAISTYAGGVRKVLAPTGMDRRGDILAAIDNLKSGGSTAMNDGLKLAYGLSLSSFVSGHVNRVIVLSDGDANVGPSSHQDILKHIKSYVDEGVTLSTIGFGMGNYKDTLMEQLANKGNGNYYYVDSFKEARKIFGEQINGTLQVVAKDVKLQVEFDADAVAKYRLIGYENRDVADKDFRNDAVDAGEIGAGHTVTALYEVELRDPAATKIATVRVRHKEPRSNTATEREFAFGAADVRSTIGHASKDFQWATAVAGFAELLRKSPYSKALSWDLILEVAQASTKGRSDRNEMVKLIKKARALKA